MTTNRRTLNRIRFEPHYLGTVRAIDLNNLMLSSILDLILSLLSPVSDTGHNYGKDDAKAKYRY